MVGSVKTILMGGVEDLSRSSLVVEAFSLPLSSPEAVAVPLLSLTFLDLILSMIPLPAERYWMVMVPDPEEWVPPELVAELTVPVTWENDRGGGARPDCPEVWRAKSP